LLTATALLGSPAAFATADELLEVTASNIVVDTATPAAATVTFDYAPNSSATLPTPPYLVRVYISPAGVNYWETGNGARDDLAVSAAGSYRNTFTLAPGAYSLSVASYPVLDCGDCGGADPTVFSTVAFTVTAATPSPTPTPTSTPEPSTTATASPGPVSTVLPSSAPTASARPNELAATGSDNAGPIVTASALTLAGAALALVVSHRRAKTNP
jgi:hypothetical protein